MKLFFSSFFSLMIFIFINGELKCKQPLVTLIIYSSQLNPTWRINFTEFQSEKNEQIQMKSSKRILGYQGFLIKCSNDEIFIHGNPSLEKQLLDSGRTFLSQEILDHVDQYLGETTPFYSFQYRTLGNTNNYCLNVPIKGPDSVPHYNPLTDNGGCFITKQSKNNCYAYGVDIVTNTFPQPGRSSGKTASPITCESIRDASIRDGLVYKGTTYPSDQPQLGHYLALFIWPNIDYHWIRKDSNGYWSHKPGPGQVTNRDNRGFLIQNPLKSNFTPWRIFCAFYIAQPSKVHIY